MLEILCKVSFFLSMLVAYAYVTSTSKVIAIVLVYSLCVFSYYYFNVIQNAIDEFFKFININEKFTGNINPSQVPIPYVSPVESASFHNIKYPSLRQMSNYRFDKSTLRHLSKVPRINSTPSVRIAPPEPTSVNHLNDQFISNNDRYHEDIKNDNDKYLQVLREISRKRNYQDEPDRVDSTPKKSRRNDIKNFMTSQSKRSHDDSSYDNLDDTSRKKRCSDFDRSVAKILSYTSSLMHVVAPNLTWSNHSKKRKSSKIEKSINDSPENVEKLRKINHEQIAEDIENYPDELDEVDNCNYVVKQQTVPVEVHENFESQITNGDECDSRSVYEPPLPDDDGEYVKVASGKILNRTNCMYRKKLNSNRIDPQSVITIEPELVNGFSNEDDETMKHNLVRTLIDDIERKGEKDESVIFYENSIVEEIAQNQNKISSTKPEMVSNNAASFNPLLSKPAPVNDAENKPNFGASFTSGPSIQPPVSRQLDIPSSITFGTSSTNTQTKPDSNSSTVFNSSVPNYSTFNANPISSSTFSSNQTSNSFAFGNNVQNGVDTVDSSHQSNPSKPEEQKEQTQTTQGNVTNNTVSFTSQTTSSAETAVASSSNGGLFSSMANTAPSSTLANSTSMVNSSAFNNVSVSSTQQMSLIDTTNTTKSEAPMVTFGTTTASPFNLGANNNAANVDSSSSVPQFGNGFGASVTINKPAENVQNTALSGISMFGNTPIATTANSSSNSNAVFTSSNSTPFTNSTPSGGFQFGQNSTPSTNASTGLSFGSTTTSSSNGFSLGTTTSAPSAFSVPTPAFGTSSASSFASPTQSAFGASAGLKFDSAPSQPASSFSAPVFNATTTASPFAAPSAPSFGSQTPAFGSTNGAFGTTNGSSQATPAFGTSASSQTAFGAVSSPSLNFGNASSQPQSTPAFGNANTQSSSTFGASQPAFGTAQNATTQSNSTFGASQPAFGTAQNSMFGSGDPSVFSQPAKPSFGTSNSTQFGSSTGFTFGSSSTNSQPSAFGSTPASTPFGSTGATQPSSFSSAPTFNFNSTNGSTSFGGNGFGATNAKPVENGFAFGSNNNVASAPAPAFQFGTAPQQPAQSQPFAFGASSGGTTGGFSIGSGGSSRNRASRSRRK